MQLEIEDAPAIDPNSWVGQAIKLTGAKTWCSLMVRGTGILGLVMLYGLGWYSTFHLEEIHTWSRTLWGAFGFLSFFTAFIIAIGSWIVTGLAAFGTVFLTVVGIKKFNCWAQNQCTPIFKDE